jgi:UDP-N-acetylmuramoyl-tripeptide--D-alanyl-D-alanine ligase
VEAVRAQDFVKAVKGTVANSKAMEGETIKSISIDSRTLREGEVFLALVGERFDGHDFIPEAISKGASLVVAKREWWEQKGSTSVDDLSVIIVEDTLKALGDFARYYRGLFDLKVIGITGANGKTTAKDMTASVLSEKFRVKKSIGNYNNLFGLPLSVLQIGRSDQVGIFEMGMSRPGEIARLTQIGHPDIGVILNIGPVHLEFMESVEKVAEAKFEMLQNLPQGAVALLNGDDPYCLEMMIRWKGKAVTFGSIPSCDFRATEVHFNSSGYPSFNFNNLVELKLSVLGNHNIYNALAASAVGTLLGLTPEETKRGLEKFAGTPMRMQKISVAGLTILNDSYNANPTSMRNALELLSQIEAKGKKVAVLGDMLELGDKTKVYHQEIGRLAAKSGLDILVTVGELGGEIAASAAGAELRVERFFRKQEVVDFLLRELLPGDILLVKASRAVGLEEVVEGIKSGLEKRD